MHCLTRDQCISWVVTNDINGIDENGEPSVVGEHGIRFRAPVKAREIERLSSDMVHWVGRYEQALLWVTDWPFYLPEEMALVQALRRSHQDSRQLIDAPGHLFDWTELEELGGWVTLTLAWGWDAYLFANPFTGRMFQTSHEDFVWMTVANASDLRPMKESVARHSLRVIEEA